MGLVRKAAGCVVRDAEGRILLLRRSPMETSCIGLYELAGGKLEEGETPMECAIIELGEETGLTASMPAKELGFHIDSGKQYYFFEFVGLDVSRVVLSEEHDDMIWICPTEIEDSGLWVSHHLLFAIEQGWV